VSTSLQDKVQATTPLINAVVDETLWKFPPFSS